MMRPVDVLVCVRNKDGISRLLQSIFVITYLLMFLTG